MKTIDGLPNIPPHEMQQYMQEMKKVDENMAQSAAPQDDIIMQLSTPIEEASPETPEEPQETKKSNYAALREAKEAAERERARAERERDELMKLLLERQGNQQNAVQQQSPSSAEEFNLAPDALAEGKHLASIHHKMRQMEERIKQYERKSQQDIVEARIKAKYPDFDTVVSASNIEELRRSHPSIAQAIGMAASQDAYSAAETAYSIIRSMGIDKSSQESSMARKMIQENASKPRSAQAVSPQRGTTPLSQVNEYINDGRMTPEYQDQLLKEMNMARMKSR